MIALQALYISSTIIFIWICAGLFWLSDRRRILGVWHFWFLLTSIIIIGLGYIAKVLAADNLDLAIIIVKFELIGYSLVTPAWLLVAVNFTGFKHWITKARVALLLFPQIVTILLGFTNEYHGLIWAEHAIDDGLIPLHIATYGTWFWMYTVYSYFITIISYYVILRQVISTWHYYRQQAITLLMTIILPTVTFSLELSGIFQGTGFTPIILSFALGAMLFWRAMNAQDLMAVVRIPPSRILHSLTNGLIILDERDRIVAYNQAALPYINAAIIDFKDSSPLLYGAYKQGAPEQEIELDSHLFDLRIVSLNSGVMLILRDITEQKQAQVALHQQAQAHHEHIGRLQDEFIQTVTHDLRDPLTAISGYAELLKMKNDIQGNEELLMLERIDSTIEHMREIIEDILDLSRLEAGMPLVKRAIVAQQILADVVENLQFYADQKSINLAYEASSDMVFMADYSLFKQAISNLVSNAIRYTPQDGHVYLKAKKVSEDEVQFSIQDTGMGIPKKDLPHLFKRFYRVKERDYKNVNSTGLGLTIVKAIVDLHVGRIWAESEVSLGTTFHISLPQPDPKPVTVHSPHTLD